MGFARSFVLAGVLAVCTSALAQKTPNQERAAALNDEARALFNDRRFEEASKLFCRAFSLHPEPRYLFNCARASEVAGDLATAVEQYDRYASLVPPPADAAEIRTTSAKLTTSLKMTSGRLIVRSDPPDAFVRLQGESGAETVSATPMARWVPAGVVRCTIEKAGFEPSTQTVRLAAGQDATIEVALTPLKYFGSLDVRANVEGASVYLDNRFVGLTPLAVDRVAEGAHTVRVERAELESFLVSVDVARDRRVTVEARLVPKAVVAVKPPPVVKARRPIWGWVALGGGVALAALGGGLHALAYDEASKANDLRPELSPSYSDDFDAHESRGTLYQAFAWTGYGLGAAAIGVGIWALVSPPSDAPAKAAVHPLLLPEGGGLAFDGAF